MCYHEVMRFGDLRSCLLLYLKVLKVEEKAAQSELHSIN